MGFPTHPEAGPGVSGPWARSAWLLLPVLVIAMVGLWVADPHAAWRFPPLVWLLAYGPAVLAIWFIVIPAGRRFLANGHPSVLMLGCGMWVVSLGVAGAAGVASRSLDWNWAIYDSAFLLSGLCHFLGVATPPRHRIGPGQVAAWLAAAYAGGLAAVSLLCWGAVTGSLPAFYVAGLGGTLTRTVILIATVGLFALAAGLLWLAYRRAPSPFLYWYALGLAIIAAALAGSMLIAAVDSPLQWTTRAARALGTVYLCLATLRVARGHRDQAIPVEAIENAWREPVFLARLHRHTALGWGLRYALAVLLTAAAVWGQLLLTGGFGPGLPPYILVYPAVIMVAVLGGFGPGVLATGLAGLAAQHWLLPAAGPAAGASPMDRLGMVIFVCMGLTLSLGADLFRRYREKAAAYDREEALKAAAQAAHERFFLALSCMTFVALVVTEDDRIGFANQAFLEMFHLQSAPATGRELLACIASAYLDPEKELARITEIVHRGVLVQDEEVPMREGRVFLRDYIPISLAGRDYGRLWIHKEITDRRRAEASLRDNQNRLEAIFASIPDVIVEYDLHGTIVRANEAALKLGGFPGLDFTNRQAIRTLKFRNLDGSALDPEQSPTFRALRGEHVAGELYAITTADGRDRVITAYSAPLMKDNEVNGVVALWHDITELKQAEQAMRALSQQLKEEAVRKDEFLALLGHELRNPLMPIGNAVYLMRKAGQDQALMDQACSIAEHQVAHLAKLVDDLLDVSRIARGKIHLKKEVIDLAQVMRGVIRDYQPVFAEHQLTLEAGLPPGRVRIDADPARIVQAVSNLLHNAIKFSDPGGRVRLAVTVPGAEWAQIEVKDSGTGIPAESLTSIFEPFMQRGETIGRTRSGLGLGLALAKGLIELHGGTITAQSDGPGRGAEFTIRLPLARPADRPDEDAQPAGTAAAARGRRILIVEDLADAATTLRLLLEMWGHEVEVAQDGRTGLEKAASFKPEIILCDIGLPGELDGYKVARILREAPATAKIRLVAMTGFGSDGAKETARQAGFEAHLTKPVEPAVLEQLIARLQDPQGAA